jgi:hypothetical protein
MASCKDKEEGISSWGRSGVTPMDNRNRVAQNALNRGWLFTAALLGAEGRGDTRSRTLRSCMGHSFIGTGFLGTCLLRDHTKPRGRPFKGRGNDLEKSQGRSAQVLPFSHEAAGGNLQTEDPALLVEPDISGILTTFEMEPAGS